MSLIGLNPEVSSNLNLSSSASLDADLQASALQILSQNCTACHGSSSGSANIYGLTDVNHLIADGLIVPGDPNQSYLLRVIQNNQMPPSGPLSQGDKETLRLWILGGGAGNGSGGTTQPTNPAPTPAPGPAPLPTDLQGQALQVLSQNCTACHGATSGSAGVFGLTNADHLISSGLVVSGNPSASRIFNVIQGGSMPPRGPLAAGDQETIRKWIAAGVTSDGGSQTPVPAPNPTPTPAPAPSLPSDIQGQALRILSQNCTACHGETSGSAGVYGLTNVDHLLSSGLVVEGDPTKSRVFTVIQSGVMPPRGALAAADQEIIRKWIASEMVTGPNQPPIPVPSPEATFKYISNEILTPKCVACHNVSNKKGGYAFDTYSGVVKAVNKSTPTDSDLYKETKKGDMPPRPGTVLNSEQLNLLLTWIKAGAPNN